MPGRCPPAQPRYHYRPKHVERIVVRPFDFEFPDDLAPRWSPAHAERSHLFNGISLTMPYSEPFFIKTLQDATAHIDDPRLLADIRDFNGQEARHFQCHRRLNELIKANGYAELAEVEARLDASFRRLSKRGLCARLAYVAGFESMTNGFTRWLIGCRRELFGEGCPYVASFWLMHMVEETEHKTVAFDAYQACGFPYLPRVLGALYSAVHILWFSVLAMRVALAKDGVLHRPRCVWRMMREVGTMLRHVAPPLLRALLPGYDPRDETDPPWMRDWIAGYARLPRGAALPLIDTHSADLPVPFAPPAMDDAETSPTR